MADRNISQEWLCTKENLILLKKTQEVSDFPDPLSLYALYRVIVHKVRPESLEYQRFKVSRTIVVVQFHLPRIWGKSVSHILKTGDLQDASMGQKGVTLNLTRESSRTELNMATRGTCV